MLENFLKRSSWTDIVISLIFILFGIFLIVNPEAIVSMISLFLGGIIILIGILRLVDYFSGDRQNSYLISVSIVAIIAGIAIMFCTEAILTIFRILIALWIIYSGITNLQTVIVWKELKSRLWLLTAILSLVTIIAGVYILINSGAVLQTIGIIILVYGIINIVENIIFIRKISN